MRPFIHSLIAGALLFAFSGSAVTLAGSTPTNINGFADVPRSHLYYRSITQLSRDNVVQGYPAGTFLPDRPITRAATLKVIVESLGHEIEPLPERREGLEESEVFTFTDVDQAAWYFPYLETAYKGGIVNGYDDKTFRPANPVTRAEALKIISEAFGVRDGLDASIFEPSELLGIPLPYDVPKDSWFSRYVWYGLNHNMIFPDQNQNLNPAEPLTRGELVDLIYRRKYPGYYSGQVQYGKATYYHDKFQDQGTASGETFDQEKLTAAHRTLPFGTQLRVTNSKTGATVEVKINDRGPYHPSAILDLSRSAFEQIGHLGSGIIEVEAEIIYKDE